MKRFFVAIISVIIVLILFGCGNEAAEVTANTVDTAAETEAVQESPSELELMLADAETLRKSILDSSTQISVSGKNYYVSNSGDDSNDGLSPESAWATVKRVTEASLSPGDAVFFERGGIFREHILYCQKGVSYSAYGEGAKPVITGSPENGADATKWTLYGETDDGGKIWLYHRKMRDCGTLVLNGGTGVRKIAPYWNGDAFMAEGEQPFDVLSGLRDLSFFSPADSLLRKNVAADRATIANWGIGVPVYDSEYVMSEGELYFRCDAGNPGEVFDSIEFSMRPQDSGDALVYLVADNTLDNLHISTGPNCGIMHNEDRGGKCEIRNCEISFCGGGVLFYDGQGRAELAGDGMNIQKPCVITNNYIHHNADNGITSEFGDGGINVQISDITIFENLFEYNRQDVQFTSFDEDMKANGCVFKDILVEGNYLLYAGGGWSNHMHADNEDENTSNDAIRCGDFSSPFYSENMVFSRNILYSETARSLINGGCVGYEPPVFENNTLLKRPHLENEDGKNAVALWGNNEFSGEEFTEWIWIFDDFVWPQGFGFPSCDAFLNEYLGTGNTLVLIND